MGRHTVFKVLPSMSLKMRPKVESRGHLGFRSPLVRMKDTSEENRPCAPGETRIYHPGLLPSFSFSFSSFLLFLVEDLDCVVACPELEATGAEEEEEEEELGDDVEAASAASTLLPHRAQERSCSSTGHTPSSTRKLTWRRKYRTAVGRGEGLSCKI